MKIKFDLKKEEFQGFTAASILKEMRTDLVNAVNKAKDKIKERLAENEKNEINTKTPDDYDYINEEMISTLDPKTKEKVSSERHITLTPVEYMRWNRFKSDHYHACCHIHNGKKVEEKVHVGYHLEIYPTGIGLGVTAVCDNCKKRVDITDYDQW